MTTKKTQPTKTPPDKTSKEPYSTKITKLISALAKSSQARELVPLAAAKLLYQLREQSKTEGRNFKGLLREARWEPLAARRMIGVYRARMAGTLTDALIAEIGWTKLKIIGSNLDEDPKAKSWVQKARSEKIAWRSLDRLAKGKTAFSEVNTVIRQTPEKRDRMNLALVRFGAVLHPGMGDRADSIYGRDEAMNAIVDFVLEVHAPAAGLNGMVAKLEKVRH